MTKVNILLPSKSIALFFLLIFLSVGNVSAQCNNPVPTGSSAQDFCKIDQPTIADLVATGGTIAWFNAPTGGVQYPTTQQLEDQITYYAEDVSNGDCSARLAVTVTIYGQEPSNVDVFVGKCAIEGATIAQLSADGTNIEWYTESTGGTLLDPTHVLEDGETYWVQQTENGCTSMRLPTTVSLVDAPAPTVNTTQSFCTDTFVTVADLTPNGASIAWYSSENSTVQLDPMEPLIDGEDYWAAAVTFPCESTVRTQTTVTIETPPDAGLDGNLGFCETDSVVENLFDLLGGTPDMTGTWTGPTALANGHLGTFDSAVNAEGVYTYTVSTGTGICPDAVSTVSVTIQRTAPPSVTDVDQTFCEIDAPTVADLIASGTSLQWFDTETSSTPLAPTDPLLDGEDYWASQTDPVSGCASLQRVVVNVTVIVVPPPTVTDVNQAFCSIENATIADLAITGNNIVWYDSDTSTTPLDVTDALIDGEDYWAAETGANGCLSATRTVINVSVIDVATPTTANAAQEFCVIDMPTIADLQVNETNLVWYDSETGTTILPDTTALVDGTSYWVAQVVNSCESPSRLEITVTLNDIVPPTTTSPAQTFCELDAATIADLDITGTNIVWYDTETDMTPLNDTDLLVDGEDYWAVQTDAASGCESSVRLAITVSITVVPPPTVTNATQDFCTIENATIADLDVTGTNVVWFDTDTSTTPLLATDALVDGEDYWAAESGANGCLSATRVVVNVNIIDVMTPTTASPTQDFCLIDNPTLADIQVNETNLVWYDSETGSTILPDTTALVDGTSYWVAQIVNACESPGRLEVMVNVNDTVPPTTANSAQTFCELDNPTIADISVNETNVVWYDSETSTTPLNATDLLVDGMSYWASQIDGTTGCESTSRLQVDITLSPLTPPTTGSPNQAFCLIDNPTVADLQANEADVFWYADAAGTTPLDPTTALVDGEDYYGSFYSAPSACEGPTRLMVSVVINDPAVPTTVSDTQSFCASDNPTIAMLDVNEVNIEWFADQTSTTPLASDTALVDGGEYWAAQNDSGSGCLGTTRLMITVVLTDPGTPSISAEGGDFCLIDEPTVSDLAARLSGPSGTTLAILNSPTGTELSMGEMLQNGQTYYAVLEDASGCTSVTPLAITVDTTQCDQYDVKFYDGFSPNGDGINDSYNIQYIRELYPDFEVRIFNRWGAEVYYMDASTPSWNGRLKGDGSLVPSGVYFYVAEFNKDGRKPEQGRLILNR